MKKIIFSARNEKTKALEEAPKAARFSIPAWFSKAPKFVTSEGTSNNILDFLKDDKGHMTFKLCAPFLDTLISGYLITLPYSLMVVNIIDKFGKSTKKIIWGTEESPIDSQDAEVHGGFPLPEGSFKQLFRWSNNWKITTPKGYSCLITHPFNRFDLPFQTLTGVIDTDKHINPIILPFFLKEDFEGEIPAGTPVAQVLPFKRDSWESEVSDKISPDYSHDSIKKFYYKTYKKLFWSKKEFK